MFQLFLDSLLHCNTVATVHIIIHTKEMNWLDDDNEIEVDG